MIDVEKGIENCGSEEIYNEVISMFCKDGRKRVKNLQKSLEEHDLSVFSLETHSLKSVAATVDAMDLAEFAAKVNKRCKDKDESVIDEQGQETIDRFMRVIEELEKKIDVLDEN